MNLSPYGLAATAAEKAKRAQVPAGERTAYVRRCAFRAVRAVFVPARWAWAIARTVERADTTAYGPRTYQIART